MRIPDAAPNRIVEIAQFAALSQREPSDEEFKRVLNATASYTQRVVTSACILGFIERTEEGPYRYIGPSELATSGMGGWSQLFRLKLQDFLPFLYFAFWISAGDTSTGAARKTCVEFSVSNNPDSVGRTFYRWGAYSEILDGHAEAPTVSASELTLVTLGFVDRLRNSLEEDLSAKLFTMSCLGAEVVSELARRSISFAEVADSLRNFEHDAATAADRSSQVVESLLASLLRDKSSDQQLPSGVGQLIDALKASDLVLTRHVDVVKALGSLRIAASHAVDRDTGQPWVVSTEGALAAIMLAIVSLRSVVKYRSSATQVL